jgi:hypothetical protein
MPAEIISTLALFTASSGFELLVFVALLLKTTEYPLEIAHFPVSVSDVSVA